MRRRSRPADGAGLLLRAHGRCNGWLVESEFFDRDADGLTHPLAEGDLTLTLEQTRRRIAFHGDEYIVQLMLDLERGVAFVMIQNANYAGFDFLRPVRL